MTAPITLDAISCSDAVAALVPCESFLLGQGPAKASNSCCSSAQALNKKADTTETRRSLCECFKQISPSVGVSPDRAALLPKLCQLNVDLNISPDVNCNK
ncbi:Bifunctional inhibitor/plant lipid transfer protein/seed storage helical domain [Dillenia turbinata]|uniref:Bifunctional inhibitor/plant lipid transfer protein/seed storage helical domain n=1 Tax=Dillenia turbinata TaxID=194707 RepID=A0AAN8UW04_9MAGN